MITIIKKCESIHDVLDLKNKHKKNILKSEIFIKDCNIRIEQIKFEEEKQIKIYNFL